MNIFRPPFAKKKSRLVLSVCFTWILISGMIFPLSLVWANASKSSSEQVYFSPKGGCTDAVVNNLNNAEKSIFVQAYSFTSDPIADALVAAYERGVKVKVLLDKSQRGGKGSKLGVLAGAGIPVSIDTKHAIAHDKVMIIDGDIVLTGSFNFTNAAEDKNAENLLVLHDKSMVKKYRANWNKHNKHSEKYLAVEKEE